MLRDKSDIEKYELLMTSLKIWSTVTHNDVEHTHFHKDTGSLYRFGWFDINGYRYSISGWKFKEGIVTFEDEKTAEKIKYDILLHDVINKEFKRDGFLTKIVKKIRLKISSGLRKLSDKLQP